MDTALTDRPMISSVESLNDPALLKPCFLELEKRENWWIEHSREFA